MIEEAHPEAAAILREAGWVPHPEWGVYTRATLVMGGVGGSFHVKDYTRIPPGHPQYGPDTPDTAEEAAAWLVERFKASEPEANPLSLDELEFRIAPEPEAEETPQHESSVSDNPGGGGSVGLADERGHSDWNASEHQADEPGAERDGALASDADPIDADFTEPQDLGAELLDEHEAELPALTDEQAILEGGDPWRAPAEEEAPQSQDRIYGLDDLDRVRAVAIHRVRLYANGLMPPWYPDDDARLATLRNFAMGVSEKRWDDDAAKQLELNALETTVRRINEIKNARDAKAEFLENATREEVGAFVVEAGWP